ncbi:MAG TPA: DUF1631 family protein [Pseudomonadales bacterium]|nr:DUF1631 family protein [Pseudomonadales bacterium]
MSPIVDSADSSLARQWFAQVRGHLLEQLNSVFESSESALLSEGEHTILCCELRRDRRAFIDNYLNQLSQRCEQSGRDWLLGSVAGATHARTLIYLTGADQVVRTLCQEQADSVGCLATIWNVWSGNRCTALDYPFSPHTLTRLFFLLLPDLTAPLRIRYILGKHFLVALPRIQNAIQTCVMNIVQQRGTTENTFEPVPLPEWWEALENVPQTTVASRGLIVPPRSVEAVMVLSSGIAAAALAGRFDDSVALMDGQRQTSLLPWLQNYLHEDNSSIPVMAREILALLAGPLLAAACDENFVDAAHPARRVQDEFMRWAPGWQECIGIEGIVPEYCRELAISLSELLLQKPASLMEGWHNLLDYLLQMSKRVQQDTSVVVASTRLSLLAMQVRTEVDALLSERAALERWPSVVIDILHGPWTGLLLGIHWREGTASDAWLNAISVADELMASVQPGLDIPTRQRQMQRIPQLLQGLRRGFEEIGLERAAYGALLGRLEAVHLALLQGKAEAQLPEASAFWPSAGRVAACEDAFDVGKWLQQADGRVWSVVFSDQWCTVLMDAHNASLDCCATATLQTEFYEGDLVVLPAFATLLHA